MVDNRRGPEAHALAGSAGEEAQVQMFARTVQSLVEFGHFGKGRSPNEHAVKFDHLDLFSSKAFQHLDIGTVHKVMDFVEATAGLRFLDMCGAACDVHASKRRVTDAYHRAYDCGGDFIGARDEPFQPSFAKKNVIVDENDVLRVRCGKREVPCLVRRKESILTNQSERTLRRPALETRFDPGR